MFAAFRQWLVRSGKPLGIETLASKHTNHSFKRFRAEMAAAGAEARPRKAKRGRPVWANAK
eukprot:4485180-Alexandrium_andersonii.AAC.1